MQVYDTDTDTVWYLNGLNWINGGNVISGTTTNSTLRWNGSNWVESVALTNDNTTVTATNDMVVNGSTLGRGSGNISTNTALGIQSLYSNTIGNYNIAVGNEALYSNTTGEYNTSIGVGALYSNTLANRNTAIGTEALYFNTTGSQNTANGRDALAYNTIGYNNTAIGASTLINHTEGYNNTVIGFNTGRGITTGANNTILGANVGGLAGGLSNNIIIADGAGNRRINVDASGEVGIGTSNPSGALHLVTAVNAQGFKHGNGSVALNTIMGSDYAGIGSVTNHRLTFYTNNGSQKMTILPNGNVGVGTSSPLSTMHVESSTGYGFRHTQGSIGLSTFIGTDYASFGTLSNHRLSFFTNSGSSALVITPEGNTAVGTNFKDAISILHIREDQDATTELRIDNENAGTNIDHTSLTLYDGTIKRGFFNQNNNTNILSLGQASTGGQVAIYSAGAEAMRINANKYVGIGTGNPTERLHVIGNILASGTITPDYVFEKYYDGKSSLKENYKMLSLSEIENFTRINKHLPGVPSAKEVEAAGGILVNRATEINLEKIEELYLHTIEQQKQITKQKEQLALLQAQVNKLLESKE